VFIDTKDPDFWSVLSQLGENTGWQSPLYTLSSLKYYRQRPLDEGKSIQDHSFIMFWEGEPVAAFIGAAVEGEQHSDLLAFEAPCHVIEDTERLTTKATKRFLGELGKIVSTVNGCVHLRDYLINGEVSAFSRYLMSNGATVTSTFSKVIDLHRDEAYLRSHLRKSYGSLVNRGMRELQPTVVAAEALNWQMMGEFRQLHIREAGRETRSESSWRRQYEMVKAGEAFMVIGALDDQMVSAGLFMYSPSSCYYGVSASRRDLFDKPLFHSLMWTAMIHAKAIRCRWFEVGEQVFSNVPQNTPPSRKEIGISEFKAGFGGATRVYLDLIL